MRAERIRIWGLLCCLMLLLPSGCRRADPVYNTRFLAFGTLMDLSLVGVEPQKAEEVAQLLEQDFAFMQGAWHAWEPGPLGRVNQLLPTGKFFAAPPSILPLLRKSQQLARQTDDLFNPAIGKLIALWGFHTDAPACRPPPDARAIRNLVRADPKMSDIEVRGIEIRSKNPAVQLDFGAIGKGYGIDLAIDHLRELGIRNAIVNAGGDLRAIGDRSGHPWRIAIRHPNGGVFAILQIAGDESVFTSGDYERNFIYEGKTYHHIIDPRTGWPAEGTRSVTVVHSDATTADAAATALFIAGSEGWYPIARRLGIRYVLLLDSQGRIHMNPAMAKRVQLLEGDLPVLLSPPLLDAP